MPIVKFVANPPPAPGGVASFTVAGPSFDAIRALVEQQRLGTPGMRYSPFQVPENMPAAVLIGWEFAEPQLSNAHVQGGQPTASPQPQPGRDVQPPPRDYSGFEVLKDSALSGADDNMFGDARDGTYCDLLIDGREVPRPPNGSPR